MEGYPYQNQCDLCKLALSDEEEEEEEDDHYVLRGLTYFLGGVAALLFLHLTAPINNPASSSLVSLFWFLLVTISLSTAWYIRVGRAGRHQYR